MTLNEIELDVYRRLDYADTPPPSVKNRIDGFINQRHRQLLASDRMRPLRLATTTLVSVPDRASYGLPYGCSRVARVMDQTNQYLLGAHTYEWAREADAAPPRVSGTPTHWIPLGYSPCAMRPFSSPTLYYSAPGVIAATGIDLAFVIDGGVTVSVHLAAPPSNGTPQAIPTGGNVTDIFTFAAIDPAAFRITLSTDLAGTQIISQIAAGTTTARYYRIGFYPSPAAAITYWVDYEREIPTLVDPSDEPLLPIDFHDIIALWARLDEYEFKSDDRWLVTKSLVEDRQKDLRAWVENHDIFRAHAIPTSPRHSRLGPYFPAGT